MRTTTGGASGGSGVAGGRVVVDPRMRSRRIEVARDAARRRLHRALVAVAAVTAVVGAYAVTRTPLLDVDHVRVAGGAHVEASDVVAASGIRRGAPAVGLDTGAAARRIEALPWVADAHVRVSLPGTVEIEVEERTPAAVVQVTDTRSAQVDATGRVLAIGGGAPPAGLVTVTGVRGRIAEGERLPAEGRDALAVARALSQGLPGVATAVSTDLEATLAAGGRVRFGTADDLDDKIVAVRTVLARVDATGLEVLDVRVPGSPALTRVAGRP